MKYLLSLFLILLCLPVFGAHTVSGNVFTITSLPDTVYQSEHSGVLWDTIIFLNSNMTSTGNGLYLAGSGTILPPRYWLIDLQGDTIEFGTADGNNLHGIKIYGGSSTHLDRYIKIQNGTIIHKPAHSRSSDTTIAQNNTCLRQEGNDVLIQNVNMRADGYNGKCIQGGGYNVEVSGGHYESLVNYFNSRCQMDALIIGLNGTFNSQFASDSGYTYSIKVHGIRMDSIPHVGIRMDGGEYGDYGIFKIYACTIMVDSRNFTYPGWGTTCHSSANPYGIATQYAGPGSEIYDNVITSGTNYGGGRGMLIEASTGTPSSYVLIHDNYLNTHEGPDAEYDETHCDNHALRFRLSGIYTHIYNNIVIMSGDADTLTSSYGRLNAAFRYTWGAEDRYPESHNIIENNLFQCTAITNAGNSYSYGVVFDEVVVPDTTLLFAHNRIESDNISVKFGEINQGAKGITLYGDTLKFLTPTYNPQTFHVGHLSNNWDCSGNWGKDLVFENGVSDTNIVFSTTTTGTLNFGLKRTERIWVIGGDNLPVQNAIVTVVNGYGQTVVTDTTGGNGNVVNPITYWWESREADSLGFNSFVIKAKKFNDSVMDTITIDVVNNTDTLILAGTNQITVTNYVIDSSTTRNYGPLSVPRYHLAPLSDSGHLVIYMSGGFPATNSDFYVTFNLDSSTRWVNEWKGVSYPLDHAHITVYNDTIYWGRGKGDNSDSKTRAFMMIGDSLTQLFEYDWQLPADSSYVIAVWRLPGSDTAISITRGYGTTNLQNFHYAISTDKGQTWGVRQFLANWGTVSTVRIGGLEYNNTIAVVACSANVAVKWYEWNRSTQVWDDIGKGINKSLYRGYSGGTYKDTTRFMTATYDSYAGMDSVFYAYRNNGADSWTSGAFETSVNATYGPASGLEYIESNKKLIVFYTQTNYASADSVDVYMRYWKPETGNWSDSTKISIGRSCINFDHCQIVPASHGNIAYVTYPMDSTIGDTVYHYGMIAKIEFNIATPEIDTLPACIVDSLHNDFSGESDSLKAKWTTSATIGYDSVIAAWSLSGYPDSSNSNRSARTYVANSTDSIMPVISITEPDTVYFSFWVKDADLWSTRQQRMLIFSITSPIVVDTLPSVTIDSLRNDFSGESDSVLVKWLSGVGAYDSVTLCWDVNIYGAYPDSSELINRISKSYQVEFLDSAFIIVMGADAIESYYLYLSVWTWDGMIPSERQERAIYFALAPPQSFGQKLRIRK